MSLSHPETRDAATRAAMIALPIDQGVLRALAFVICTLLSCVDNRAVAFTSEPAEQLRFLVSHPLADSGLAQALIHGFREQHPSATIVLESVTGPISLQSGNNTTADVILSRYPVEGPTHTLILYNELAIFGPPHDPLNLLQMRELQQVLQALAEYQAPLLYPEKHSPMAKKLAELWVQSGIEPDWPSHESADTDPQLTLRYAANDASYAFADMASYAITRDKLNGEIIPLFHDHKILREYYSAMVVEREQQSHSKLILARRFVDYLASEQGQNVILNFGQEDFGKRLFIPAAHLDQGLSVRRAQRELQQKSQYLGLTTNVAFILTLLLLGLLTLYLRTQKRERSHQQNEERLRLAVNGSNDGIWDWDVIHNKAYFSPRTQEILGLARSSEPFSNPLQLWKERIHPDDIDNSITRLRSHLHSGDGALFVAEYRTRRQNGQYGWVLLRGKTMRNSVGQVSRMTGSITDITDLKAMKHQSMHDPLTGLPNRGLLYEALQQAIISCTMNKRSLALIIMDLDRFKNINDTLGHHFGDQVLQQVGRRIQQAVADTDTVVRLGGDEFAVLLPQTDEFDAKQTAQKILQALEKVFELDHHNLYVGASLGIALFPQHGNDVQNLIQHADVAMYVAKRANSGCAVYNSDKDTHSVRSLALEKELHDAIENNILQLYYQPKINLTTGNIVGVEALLRWPHPQLGFIPPEEMIPIAEQTGLIKRLTEWVLDTALSQSTQWAHKGIDLKMAVNLSVWNLQDPGLIQQITAKLGQWDMPPSRLELEITESAMMADPDHAEHVLLRLHAMGINLAIDDYGTGFSSLAYLKKFPVGLLKIDKSFVMGMVRDENDATIVRSTIELAHNLGMNVVAEGAENSDIYDILTTLGCETAQGYYFGRPQPAAALAQWLHASPWSMRDGKYPSSA